jgi:hypothetical protein
MTIVICPATLQSCSDERCLAWGCAMTAAAPLMVCSECGEAVAWPPRRIALCEACLAGFAVAVAKEA